MWWLAGCRLKSLHMLLSHPEFSFLFLDALPFLSFFEDRWTSKWGTTKCCNKNLPKPATLARPAKYGAGVSLAPSQICLESPLTVSLQNRKMWCHKLASVVLWDRVTAQPASRAFYSMLTLQKKRGLCCHFSLNKRRVRPSQANSPKNANGKKIITIRSITYFPSSQ